MKPIAYGTTGVPKTWVGIKAIVQEAPTFWRVTLKERLPKHATVLLSPEVIGTCSSQIGWHRVQHDPGTQIMLCTTNTAEIFQVGFVVYDLTPAE